MPLSLQVITQEKVLYDDEVNEVVIPTLDGIIGILPHHTPLLSQIAPGELDIKKGNSTESLAVTGGFLEMSNNKLTILADFAIRAQDIEVAKAEQAKERAEKLMKEKVSEQEYAELNAEFIRAITELKVARRHRTK